MEPIQNMAQLRKSPGSLKKGFSAVQDVQNVTQSLIVQKKKYYVKHKFTSPTH